MSTIVVIDDTQSLLQLITLHLKQAGHQVITAADGVNGLRVAQENKPDLIITDVMMPGMDGYELTRRLRRELGTTHIPIITLTARSELESKIKAFESGADDFMTKPFDPGELVARVNVLLRRMPTTSAPFDLPPPPPAEPTGKRAHLIAVHSLRGGVGCSTLATNTALGLVNLWDDSVLLADFVTTTGQIALMLNMPLKRTWADIIHIPIKDLAMDELESIITTHASGLRVLMAPTDTTQSAHLTSDRVERMLKLVRPRFDYIIADLTHDFNDIALQILDAADLILLVLAPDLASIRAASATLETYKQLEYPTTKIFIVINWTFERQGFGRKEIEEALELPVSYVIPYAAQTFVNAINRGMPPVFEKPDEPITAYLEELAFLVSRQDQRATTPPNPKPALKRLQKRLATARK